MSSDPIDPPVPSLPSQTEVASEETLHFDYPDSDIVLRSCDSHNFHVLKLYIVNSSPVLREIIGSVSSASDVARAEEPEPLPVVELSENGAILHSLLTLIFPVDPVLPSSSEKIMELLATAQKYQMDSVLSHVRAIVGARKDPPFILPETAVHIYFLAQTQGLRKEAVHAARVTLRLSMDVESLGDMPRDMLDFPGPTGAYLYELWKYHERIRTDLKSGILEFQNSGLPDDVNTLRCRSISTNPYQPMLNETPSFPLWIVNYLNSIVDAPHLSDLFSLKNAWARHIQEKADSCKSCSCVGISIQVMRSFWEALTTFVDGAIERVSRASDEASLQ